MIALAERGALFDPGPCMYMEKLAGVACPHIICCSPWDVSAAVSSVAWVLSAERFGGCAAVGQEVNPHMVSLLYPVERNLKAVGVALNKPVS